MNNKRIVLVQGASRGLGLAFVEELRRQGHTVVATCRDPAGAADLATLDVPVIPLDVTDEASIRAAAARTAERVPRLDLLLNVAGVLHGAGFQPEKRFEHLDPAAMQQVFAVNAFGPALVMKHFFELLAHGERAVIANLSARVGSIGDNHLGGWYTYRASKAAQNQFTRTFAIEARRRARGLIVVGLHPGTVDTDLSGPFQRHVPKDRLFERERAARQLLEVIEGLGPDDTGKLFAWDGSPIPW